MANIAYFDRFFQCRLSLRRQFFSAGSACVGKFLVQAQPAQKKKNGEYLPRSSKNFFFSSPQVTYPYRIYWCQTKIGQKSHTWAPLKKDLPYTCHIQGTSPSLDIIFTFKEFSKLKWRGPKWHKFFDLDFSYSRREFL